MHSTQVRRANFVDEILDGISNLLLVLYRSGCYRRSGVLCLRSRAREAEPVVRIVTALAGSMRRMGEVSSGASWSYRP